MKELPLVQNEAKKFEPLQQDWVYAPKDVIAVLQEWDMTFDTASGKHVQTQHEFCRLREILGSTLSYMAEGRLRPIYDTAPVIESPYPAKATYKTTFQVPSFNGEQRRLLIEGSTLQGNWKLEVNGHTVTADQFEAYRVYDFTNKAADITALLQVGENTIVVSWDAAEEFDGLESLMYIL